MGVGYVDERLVEPETRQEVVRGCWLEAPAADPVRGDALTEVITLVRVHVAPGYTVSTHLLTRAGPESDFASDVCVRRAGIDPETGWRYLEELAFEVIGEQPKEYMIERAQDLTACGVRRLIAVFVEKGEICEWVGEDDRWSALDVDGLLEDPTLIRPFPLRALLDRAVADDVLAKAAAAKRNRGLAQRERSRGAREV